MKNEERKGRETQENIKQQKGKQINYERRKKIICKRQNNEDKERQKRTKIEKIVTKREKRRTR